MSNVAGNEDHASHILYIECGHVERKVKTPKLLFFMCGAAPKVSFLEDFVAGGE